MTGGSVQNKKKNEIWTFLNVALLSFSTVVKTYPPPPLIRKSNVFYERHHLKISIMEQQIIVLFTNNIHL